jgi:hypothetical protein
MDIKSNSLRGLLRRVEVGRGCTKDFKTSFLCLKPWHDNPARHSQVSRQSQARRGISLARPSTGGGGKLLGIIPAKFAKRNPNIRHDKRFMIACIDLRGRCGQRLRDCRRYHRRAITPYPHPRRHQCSLNRRAMLNDAKSHGCRYKGLFARHPHVIIDGGGKSCEASTAQCSSLRPSFVCKRPPRYTTCSNGIFQVGFCPEAFDAAFRPRVDCTNKGKIFGG